MDEQENETTTPAVQPYFVESFAFILEHICQEKTFKHLFDETDEKFMSSFKKLTALPDLSSFSIDELLNTLERKEVNDLAAAFKLPLKGSKNDLICSLLKISREKSILSFFGPKENRESRLRQLCLRSLGTCYCLQETPAVVFTRSLLLFSIASDQGGPLTQPLSLTAHLSGELYNLFQLRRGDVVYPAYAISRRSQLFRSRDELTKFFELYALRHELDCLLLISNYELALERFSAREKFVLSVLNDPSSRRSDLPAFLQRFSPTYLACGVIRIAIGACERLRQYTRAATLIRALLCPAPTSGAHKPAPSVSLLTLIGSRSACKLILRFIIDEGVHCGRHLDCLTVVRSLLSIPSDFPAPYLRAGYRLEVKRQVGRLLETATRRAPVPSIRKSRKRKANQELSAESAEDLSVIQHLSETLVPSLKEPQTVKLTAPTNASSADLGTHRPHYLWTEYDSCASSDGDRGPACSSLLITVEDWVLRHFTHNEGFEKGLHSESRVFVTLFGLLFYDLLFAQSRDDVFYSMRQTAPLDLFTDDFYVTRQSAVEMRLELIARAERTTNAQLIVSPPSSSPRSIGEGDLEALFMDPVSRLLTSAWTEHHGERCIGVSWDLFSSVSEVVELFWCLGPQLVASCCRLLATDYRNWQSGLPDLCLWSPSQSKAKLVEVKGPGDSLSCQQMVWIDKLISFGADVVLCTVSAISRNSLDFKQ
ncbi:Fanconi-associated nuclease 1 [Sparganum proliferum]